MAQADDGSCDRASRPCCKQEEFLVASQDLFIDPLEIDVDFVVALPNNGRGDLAEEVPKGGYKVFYG